MKCSCSCRRSRQALAQAGLDRREVGFTCAGSCDYLTGGPFAFVQNLEAAGAWPPISESHVEMDGAWALYEAWVRLAARRHRHRARVRLGKVVAVEAGRNVGPAARPVLPRAARRRSGVARRACRRARSIDAGEATERDFAEVAARSRRNAMDNPNAQVQRRVRRRRAAAASRTCRAPLRRHDLPPISDGAVAVVLARGDKARALCERPAWIRGHRPSHRGAPARDARSHRRRRRRRWPRARPATTAARSTSPSCRRRSARRS